MPLESAPYALFAAVPLIGHLNPLLRQAEELHRRGWLVSVANVSELRDHVAAEAPHASFVDLGSLGSLSDSLSRDQEAASSDTSFVRGTMRIVEGLHVVWHMMYDGIASSVRSRRPDVMVVDLFSSAALSVADARGIPFVVNNPDLLACLPVALLPPADRTPFLFSGVSIRDVPRYQPLIAPFVRRFAAAAALLTVERQWNAHRRSRQLPASSTCRLLRGKPVLVNGVFGLEYPRTLPPQIEMVGPMLCDNIPALPAEISEWLDDRPPVVYVNLGTMAVVSKENLLIMSQAFGSANFRILWILKKAQAAHLSLPLPLNMKVLDWGPPPVSILSHHNVKVFVSHCGINSVYESLSGGTPIVGIPMFADQRDMAVRVSDAGAGLWLNKERFTVASLRGAIQRLLEDDSFSQNAEKIRLCIANAGKIRRAADIIAQTACGSAGHSN